MAILPWRFQADLAKGEVDPLVTVFVGPERQMMDDTGAPTGTTFIDQTTTNPATLKLSELPAALANPSILVGMRTKPGP